MPGTQPTLTNDGPIPQAWAATGQALGSLGAQTSASALQTSSQMVDEYQNTIYILGALNQAVTAGAGWDLTVTPPAQGNAIPGVQIGTGIGGFGIGVPSATPIFTTCTITSIGVSTQLTTALINGNAVTSLAVTALSAAIPNGTHIAVTSGSNSQIFVTDAAAAAGATSISVTSLNANYSYPIGSIVSTQTCTVASASGLAVGMMIGATDWQYGQADPANNTYEPALTPGTAIAGISGLTVYLSDPALIAGSGLYCVAMAAWKNLVQYFTANVVP